MSPLKLSPQCSLKAGIASKKFLLFRAMDSKEAVVRASHAIKHEQPLGKRAVIGIKDTGARN